MTPNVLTETRGVLLNSTKLKLFCVLAPIVRGHMSLLPLPWPRHKWFPWQHDALRWSISLRVCELPVRKNNWKTEVGYSRTCTIFPQI